MKNNTQRLPNVVRFFLLLLSDQFQVINNLKMIKISTEEAYIYATKNVDVSSAVRMLLRSEIFDVVVSLPRGKPLVHRKSLVYLHFP